MLKYTNNVFCYDNILNNVFYIKNYLFFIKNILFDDFISIVNKKNYDSQHPDSSCQPPFYFPIYFLSSYIYILNFKHIPALYMYS